MEKLSGAFFLLFALFHLTQCDEPYLTTKEVPLYIRQAWIERNGHVRTYCIGVTGVDPTVAYQSMMKTQIRNNANLKRYFKCVAVQMNLLEETTGNFVELEFLRQVEGCTSEIFKKCNDKVKTITDLNEKSFAMYLCLVYAVAKPKSPQHDEPPNSYQH